MREPCLDRNPQRRGRIAAATALVVLALGGVTCHDAGTGPGSAVSPGGVVWQVAGPGWGVTPSYDSSRVYFGTLDHRLVAFDRESGAFRWEASTGNGPCGATAGYNSVIVGDVVVLGDVDMYAFDRATGARRWTFRASDLDETGTHRLEADDSTIFASSLYGRVYAIVAATGVLRWVTPVPTGGVRTATFDPVVHDGVVYVGVWHETNPLSGGLAALDATSGQILWVHAFTPWRPGAASYCHGGAVVYGDLVIASAADGRIYGLDRATGDERWIAPPVDSEPFDDTRWLALAGWTVVASSMRGVATGLDAATGSVKWSTALSLASMLGDVPTDGRMAILSLGELVAVDVADGSVLWRTGTRGQGSRYYGEPAIDGPRVYGNRGDAFIALRAR
jgi:outer membrane protein assembly factor BamB